MRALNLGIVAHVDAGKTSLTERLLYATGVIDQLGSVDDGSTRTDTSALERRRGITINAAVVSFMVDGTTVNLIDTPGHPDFIAEVERALGVLDGAVLVVSAVEGVQSQTRVLMRALQRLRIPTLIFINKIDRPGARYGGLLRDLAEKLTPDVVAMGSVRGLGTREAAFVAHDRATSGPLSSSSPTTTTPSSPPSSTVHRSRTTGLEAASRACLAVRWPTPCSSVPRSPAPAPTRCSPG